MCYYSEIGMSKVKSIGKHLENWMQEYPWLRMHIAIVAAYF